MSGAGDLTQVHAVGGRASLTAAVVPSRAQRIGAFLLLLACAYLLGVLVTILGRGSTLASHGAETLGLTPVLTPVLLTLVILTLVLARGVALPTPKAGRSRRIVAQVSTLLGIAAVFVSLFRSWLFDIETGGWPWTVLSFVGLALVAPFVLLRKSTRPVEKAWSDRLGTHSLYRSNWLGLRLRALGALWWLAIVSYAIILPTGGWAVRPGGYLVAVLLALGAVGAAMLAIRHRGRKVLVDTEGRIFEPNELDGLG